MKRLLFALLLIALPLAAQEAKKEDEKITAQAAAPSVQKLFLLKYADPAKVADLQHKRHPEYFHWLDLPFWNFFLFCSITLSRRIVAVSGATADDLRRFYRLPPARIRTVLSGVDPRFFDLAAHRRPEPFLLAVSTLHPHKNLDGLLRAFAAFAQRHAEYRLIVCGMHGFFSAELHALDDRGRW